MDKFADIANKVMDKILSLIGPTILFIVLIAVALLLFIFLIVMICQGAKISKLKKQNAEQQTALEKERANQRIAEQKAANAQAKEEQAQQSHVGEVKWSEYEKTEPKVQPTQDEDENIEVVEDESEKEEKTDKPAPAKKAAPQIKVVSSLTPQPTAVKYVVAYDKAKESWTIKKAGSDRVLRRVGTKEEAMSVARELSRKTGASLEVHKKDGKFQRQ